MGKHKQKKIKKHKKDRKHKKKDRKYSTSSSSTEEWIEKSPPPPLASTSNASSQEDKLNRDEWMSLPTSFTSVSNIERRKEREINNKLEKDKKVYNPRENDRELNPYWKSGGDGLPTFQKCLDNSINIYKNQCGNEETSNSIQGFKSIRSISTKTNDANFLAGEILKAEILGDEILVKKLKDKLETALNQSQNNDKEEREVILTQTDSKGYSRPLQTIHGEYSGGQRKKKRVETHTDGQRVRYFPEDDKVSLKQMFENEKYVSPSDSNTAFLQVVGKIKNDDLDDVFIDNIRKNESDEKINRRNRERAINEHRETVQALENCYQCLQSEKMQQHLMVSMFDTMYLSVPHHEPLTGGHCLIVPIRHVSCATQLDENEWSEMLNFRKSLVNMFSQRNEDVIFFEVAMFLHRHPHMILHCIPVPKKYGDVASIYFKKAIDESEMEWASNKKLVSLTGRDVRRAIPKGLPYFAVSFGMEEGFAHVIEDQRLFPHNFAQEIIGGILNLHYNKWRKPKTQKFDEQKQRASEFYKEWNKFDFSVRD